MTENDETIADAAMTLTPGARAILAGRLLLSITPDQETGPQRNGSTPAPAGGSKPTSITLRLTPDLRFGLEREAGARRTSPEQFALEALEKSVAQSLQERASKVAEMFRQWNEAEVDESEALDDEFFKQLDENRTSFRKLFPPELKGISW
jgi:predicted transcriptional regulator